MSIIANFYQKWSVIGDKNKILRIIKHLKIFAQTLI